MPGGKGGDWRRQERAKFKNWIFDGMLKTFEKDLSERAPYLVKGQEALGISAEDASIVFQEVKRHLKRERAPRES